MVFYGVLGVNVANVEYKKGEESGGVIDLRDC